MTKGDDSIPKTKTMYMRLFECPDCKTRMTAPKKRKSAAEHKKWMWCYKCEKKQNFIMIDEDRKKG